MIELERPGIMESPALMDISVFASHFWMSECPCYELKPVGKCEPIPPFSLLFPRPGSTVCVSTFLYQGCAAEGRHSQKFSVTRKQGGISFAAQGMVKELIDKMRGFFSSRERGRQFEKMSLTLAPLHGFKLV